MIVPTWNKLVADLNGSPVVVVPNNVVPLNRFVVNCRLPGVKKAPNKANTSQGPGHGTDTGFDVKAICTVFSAGTIKVSANTDGHVKAIKLVQARPMHFTN